jgi:hypothetical protein
VITLQPLDRKREGTPQLREEREARAMVQTAIEPQHAEARTVVQGGVLECPPPRDLHVLHVDLNRLARFRFFEEFHLAGFPFAGPPQAGQS